MSREPSRHQDNRAYMFRYVFTRLLFDFIFLRLSHWMMTFHFGVEPRVEPHIEPD